MKKIMWLNFLAIPLWSIAQNQETLCEKSPYFNTAFLANYEEVNAALCQEGFKKICIPTDDGLNLDGLFLERPDAIANIIICCGFYPGRKEGMATLYAMIPTNYNILFFDARGHGTSEGRFWSSLHTYGLHEYRDVIGALEYVHEHTQKPTLLYGICAGSFHATRALIELKKKNLMEHYGIRGLIFDSGLVSIVESTDIPRNHLEHKVFPGIIRNVIHKNDSKKQVKDRYIYKIGWYITACVFKGVEMCIKPFLQWHETETNLVDKIGSLDCPILFIHAKNDTHAPWKTVLALAEKSKKSQCWWIETSEHAANHLKHKHEYTMRLCEFITQALTNQS